ncbi:MAG: molybdopterin molybdotransferase MoeA [Phycisphaerae bacterium]|jgi:molybdopterin molybdotransferase|nr:molybdopterin molybdotransferase MoeA [Phycisphaerae bacterium]
MTSISPRKAWKTIIEYVRPLASVRIPLIEALGACLARDVRADRDLPPTDRSAMDGFALRSGDIDAPPASLRLIGESTAGGARRPNVSPGVCVRIMTGAVVPRGADTVVKVEETAEADGQVTFSAPATRGVHIRRRGEVAAKGDVILTAGTVLDPAQVGLCAAVGKQWVWVHRRPSVAILCTGKELKGLAEKVKPHQLRNSNGPALQAALIDAERIEARQQIIPDDPVILAEKLKAAVNAHDVVILTGGVSVGKYDFVPGAVEQIGGAIRFHGVRMKPGGPQLYATLSGNRHIFGLPGNPLSALNGLHELALPAIRRMSGLPANACRPILHLPLDTAVRVKGARWEYVLARLIDSPGGSRLRPLRSTGSGDLVAAAQADGVILVPRNVAKVPAGQIVEFRPWRTLL